jgi:hypothetical protein
MSIRSSAVSCKVGSSAPTCEEKATRRKEVRPECRVQWNAREDHLSAEEANKLLGDKTKRRLQCMQAKPKCRGTP